MRKGKLKILIIFLLGGLIGFGGGNIHVGSAFKSYILQTNATLLAQQIGHLAMLHNGDIDGCITYMERSLDSGVLQVAMTGKDRQGRFDPTRLPSRHLLALQVARIYADAGFDDVFSKTSKEILAQVEPAKGKACMPALRSLQERSSGL